MISTYPRVFLVAGPRQDAELVSRVQAFRGKVYLAEGAVAELVDGRHIEIADASSFHLIAQRGETIEGCLRYQRIGAGRARVGGWAVDPKAPRGLGITLIVEAVELARSLGDHYATATATTRNCSAAMLTRMGARSLLRYYDSAYRCEMELLEFRMAEFSHRRREKSSDSVIAA